MEVKIMSGELVKPSTPTPNEKRSYKQSLFDQMAPQAYTSFILFYSKPENAINTTTLSDNLKSSLSKTLTHFYPFAGRIKEGSVIECNDRGAYYVVANVDSKISASLEQPDIHALRKLLPSGPDGGRSDGLLEPALVLVQVNFFACGGVAIGFCISHVIADAAAFVSFVVRWAGCARGTMDQGPEEDTQVVIDCASMFPPNDELAHPIRAGVAGLVNFYAFQNKRTKRFVFEGSKIATLRDKMLKESTSIGQKITRVEALCGLIWGAVIATTQLENDQSTMKAANRSHMAFIIVNLRRRMSPPLPNCVGNFATPSITRWPLNAKVDYVHLAEKIGQSIREINEEYSTSYESHLMNFYTNVVDHLGTNPHCYHVFSSWCKFPFYEADFGWGKPVFLVTGFGSFNNSTFLVDAKDGEGVEAWITLPEEVMVKFEQNPEILAFGGV